MKDYLLGKRDNIGNIENHIFFFDDVAKVYRKVEGIDISDLHPNATTQQASEAMSETQKNKVIERINKAGESVKDSAVFQDWINDRNLL